MLILQKNGLLIESEPILIVDNSDLHRKNRLCRGDTD